MGGSAAWRLNEQRIEDLHLATVNGMSPRARYAWLKAKRMHLDIEYFTKEYNNMTDQEKDQFIHSVSSSWPTLSTREQRKFFIKTYTS